ncbi:hypothetical protein RIR_jg28595.t1 [Rhizophagus irregularis DAOM 181602=DAOM 197198]|nr:hypothetical protein RIR_jg28595.t1 [Rhizophagus irregularis DAOM 181602=DAOM 197198]
MKIMKMLQKGYEIQKSQILLNLVDLILSIFKNNEKNQFLNGLPAEQKIKTMIAKSYQHNYENLNNILNETAATVSLTTDLWFSRAKHGYIGITAV